MNAATAGGHIPRIDFVASDRDQMSSAANGDLLMLFLPDGAGPVAADRWPLAYYSAGPSTS